MPKLKIAVLLLVVFSIGISQTKILLCDFEPRGVDTSLIQLTGQLLRDELNATYKYIVIDPPSGTKCYNVIAAAELARKYECPKALIGNIMQIGAKTYISYQLVDATTSSVEFADKTETPRVEEFPIMCERIVASIVAKKPYLETIEMEKITEPEVEPRFKRPRQPYASIFLTAGYQFFPFEKYKRYWRDRTNTLSSNLVNLNIAASFETRDLLTMLQMGLMRGYHEEKDINFDLMLNYIMGKGDFAPLVGGGIGITRFRWEENGEKKTSDGLSLSLGAGMIGLRTYYFRLITAVYGNWTFASDPNWGSFPGFRVWFGVTTPSLGPDATVKFPPGCVGGIIGGFFITGLIIALTS